MWWGSLYSCEKPMMKWDLHVPNPLYLMRMESVLLKRLAMVGVMGQLVSYTILPWLMSWSDG